MQQFTVGDHVIVDEGRSYMHRLNIGFDAKVAGNLSSGDSLLIEGYSDKHRSVIEHYVHPGELIKLDDLVTRPEGKFKVGDRVLIVGDSGNAGHYLALADARIIEALDDDREYFVTGVDNHGDVASWYVNERDLEAEPTFGDYVSFDLHYTPRRLEFVPSTTSERRERALRVAFEMTDPYDDVNIARIIDLAEYLLSGKVPA